MIRPCQDWMLVKLDEIPEKQGSLYVAPSAEERVRTGTILRTGPGQWLKEAINKRRPLGVEVGERVAFFRENFETSQGKQIASIVEEIEPGTVMVRARDLLYAIGPKE